MLARLRGGLGNGSGEGAVSPLVRLRHLYRVQPIAEHTLQLRAPCDAGGRYHSLTTVQAAGDSVHGDLPQCSDRTRWMNIGSTSLLSFGAPGDTRLQGNGQSICLLMPMDRFCLQIICASILLLVTAFALGTPGFKSEGTPEKTVLLQVATRR